MRSGKRPSTRKELRVRGLAASMDASDYCKKVSLCELHTFRVPEHAAPAQHLAPARKMAREEYCARSKAGSAAGHRAGAGGRRAGKSNGGTRPGRRLQCPSPARGEGVSPTKGCALKIGASLGWNWNSLTVDGIGHCICRGKGLNNCSPTVTGDEISRGGCSPRRGGRGG